MEICELMPTQHAVQLAVKYATRLRFMQLATQLNELAHRKAAEEMEEEEEEEPVYVAPQRPVNRLVNGACCPGISLSMRSANERRRYILTSSSIGWAHTQNNPWLPWCSLFYIHIQFWIEVRIFKSRNDFEYHIWNFIDFIQEPMIIRHFLYILFFRSKPVVNGHAATNTEAEEEMEADDLDESTDIYEEISSQQDGDEEPRHKGQDLGYVSWRAYKLMIKIM